MAQDDFLDKAVKGLGSDLTEAMEQAEERDFGDGSPLEDNLDEESILEGYTEEERANFKGIVGLISLGCAKNTVDSEQMLGRFVTNGYGITSDPQEADILVVNTCGFIEDAAKESQDTIDEMSHLKALYPGKKLVVTGCLSQRHGETMLEQHPAIDLLLGAGKYDKLIPLVEADGAAEANQVAEPDAAGDHSVPRVLTSAEGSAYIKIAEGCNQSCAFCIIPQLRGPFRSRGLEDLTTEARHLDEGGVRELVLISQDTTWWGRDLEPRSSLAKLLEQLLAETDIPWIRMLYLYPTLVNSELLETMAQHTRLIPYFDIPLQHADSGVLTRMKRAERLEGIRKMVASIREKMPNAVLRSTFIVGFPGEDQEAFEVLHSFIKEAKLDWVGVFQYSDEEGTDAFTMGDKVDPEVAQERYDILMQTQQQITRERLKKWLGETLDVLVEEFDEEDQCWVGRFWGQAPEVDGRVLIQTFDELEPGEMLPVKIEQVLGYDLYGEPA
uniref:Ribosomal protein uS12 methylthiotransferase RimO n=1 Tax=Magnetococcus massalia (strain MO-1) TaxID=451514 RepID=A0A1S7LFF8_MAGMO|nr:Ribosomal protein S12 methylthiotransferase rimO [Candidatus Magnetococcus massalia]